MSVEYLDLRADCLAEPSRWDLAVIEARMLWPHDADLRDQYLSAVSVKVAVASIDRVPIAKPTPTEVRELAEAMLSAPRVEDFTEAGAKAKRHGMVAGTILYDALGFYDIGRGNTSLGDIKRALAARLGPEEHLTEKTLDNTVWRLYRSVAHFWAGHILISRETDSRVFPCRLRDLDFFLATADACRLRGETIRSSPKSPTTVLRPGEAVMIPPAIALPEIEVSFSAKN